MVQNALPIPALSELNNLIAKLNRHIEGASGKLDNLSEHIQAANSKLDQLNGHIQAASDSSGRLAGALNRLTLLGAIVGAAGVLVSAVGLWHGWNAQPTPVTVRVVQAAAVSPPPPATAVRPDASHSDQRTTHLPRAPSAPISHVPARPRT